MSRRVAGVLLSLTCGVAGACSGGDRPPEPTAPPAPATALHGSGAGSGSGEAPAPIDAGITTLPTFDPSAGHLDGDDGAVVTSRRPGTVRSGRTLEIVLRSTPAGALAAVDGVVVGRTPAYWEGDFTGREREFTFVLPGHAVGRYRFVPTTSGVVHAPLVKLETPHDAGMPEIPAPMAPTAPPAPARAPAKPRVEPTPIPTPAPVPVPVPVPVPAPAPAPAPALGSAIGPSP
jgi:hypothetical protein